MHGIIYQYTNTLSGLVYVGQTINPQSRRRTYVSEAASPRPNPRCVIQAMQQAGLDTFTYQVLAEATSHDDLNRLEIHYIALLRANDPRYGYNRTSGGQESGTTGYTHSAETKAKIGHGNRGKILSAETRAKIAQAKCGTTLSAETRAKMSQAHRDRPRHPHSAETKAKMSLAKRGNRSRIGCTHSAETKAKIGRANSVRIISDETRAKLSLAGRGRAHSDETKAKMSLAQRGRIFSAESKAKMSLAHRDRAHIPNKKQRKEQVNG